MTYAKLALVAAFPVIASVILYSLNKRTAFAVLFVPVYFLIKKLAVENIHKINTTLSEITGGNLNVSVNVRNNEEFVSLSDDINSTAVTLKPDPNTALFAEERDIGGLGIFMVKKTMDSVSYEYHDGLNILTLTKQYE